jgi:hypothetical protein
MKPTMPLLLTLALVAPAPAATPTVVEVLDRYAAAQKALERCEQVTDVQGVLSTDGNAILKLRQRGEYRRDGGRAFCCSSDLRDDATKPMPDALPPLPSPAATDTRFQSLYSSVSTAEGVTSYLHYPKFPANGQVILDVVEDEAERLQLLPNDRVGCWMRGWLFEDRRRIDDILRSAGDKATARPDTVDGRPCTVVEARTEGGRYVVWFDPGRGGNVVRLRVERGPHDLTRYGQVWAMARRGNELPEKVPYGPEDEKARQAVAIDDVLLERVGDGWLPVSATLSSETVGRDGRRRGGRSHVTTRWNVSPQFDANALRLDVPDGTVVSLRAGNDFVFPPLQWHGGRPVPAPEVARP